MISSAVKFSADNDFMQVASYSNTKTAERPMVKRPVPTRSSNTNDAPSDDRRPAISTLVSRISVGVIVT